MTLSVRTVLGVTLAVGWAGDDIVGKDCAWGDLGGRLGWCTLAVGWAGDDIVSKDCAWGDLGGKLGWWYLGGRLGLR